VPRNTKEDQLVELAGNSDSNDSDNQAKVELEQNYINGKLKTLTAYYGALVASLEGQELDQAPAQETDPTN